MEAVEQAVAVAATSAVLTQAVPPGVVLRPELPSDVDAPDRLVDVLVLSPLAVAPGYQGKGIGSALVRHGLAEAKQRGESLVYAEPFWRHDCVGLRD